MNVLAGGLEHQGVLIGLLDRPGRPIYDPVADAAFVARLKERLDDPARVHEVDLHLYTPEFARVAVDEFVRLFERSQAQAVALAG